MVLRSIAHRPQAPAGGFIETTDPEQDITESAERSGPSHQLRDSIDLFLEIVEMHRQTNPPSAY